MANQTDEQKAAAEFGLSDALPDGWKPTEGSTLIGPVLALTKGWSDYQNEYYPIVIMHDEITNKDVAVHGFHYVLRERLSSLRPLVGERLGIKMGPKVALKSNAKQSVQTYTVKIDGRTEDIWNDIKNPRAQAGQAYVQDSIPVTDAVDEDIPF